MKKLSLTISSILFFLLITISLNAQDTNFSVELQNSNVHNAIIYPNPITDFKFNVKSEQIISSIEVLNAIGNSIYFEERSNYTTESILINIPRCDKGMYLCKITFDDNEYIIKKLLIK